MTSWVVSSMPLPIYVMRKSELFAGHEVGQCSQTVKCVAQKNPCPCYQSNSGRCQFSSTVSQRIQNHIRFRPREKHVALKPVERYIRFRPPPLFMFASPSTVPIPVAARSKLWVCGRSLAGIKGSNSAGGMNVCLLWVLCVVLVAVSASDWSLVQRSPTEWGVSGCDHEASTMRSPWPTMGSRAME
jgi:hypothetical protein